MTPISDADLASFMDEALSVEEMARIEAALRRDRALRKRLESLRQSRDQGWHSVGAIWRTHRLSCPSRSQLGGYLLDALDASLQGYIRLHLEAVGCRSCQADLADLRARDEGQAPQVVQRRRRLFQSSVGHLKGGKST